MVLTGGVVTGSAAIEGIEEERVKTEVVEIGEGAEFGIVEPSRLKSGTYDTGGVVIGLQSGRVVVSFDNGRVTAALETRGVAVGLETRGVVVGLETTGIVADLGTREEPPLADAGLKQALLDSSTLSAECFLL